MNYSNNVKVLMVPEIALERQYQFSRSKCLEVQQFDYQLRRTRNESLKTVGGTIQPTLVFTLRLTSFLNAEIFYDHLKKREPFGYTFLFNATFNPETNMLDHADDEMLVRGYVVDVQEEFNARRSDKKHLALITVELKLTTITYVGEGRELEHRISNTVDY